MAEIDDRVVSMKFDNADFMAKTKQTSAALSGLNDSLKFSGATKGMAAVQNGINSFNLDPIAKAVDVVSQKITGFQMLALGVMDRVAGAAVNFGRSLVNNMGIGAIREGWGEYELTLNSIQTMLANTKKYGTTIADVNRVLDELNTYADKTIYNFGQMTHSIGTFTTAGINLEDSASAIKGIANASALAGANAEQAQSAMYMLSQAMSQGSMQLYQWRSLELSGIGGEQLQRVLFETAKAKGKIAAGDFDTWTKNLEKSGKSFRESLSEEWVDNDVLKTALKVMSNDMTDAELKTAKFSDSQIKYLKDIANTAMESATKVKTFPQAISTIQEGIGSGWATTFRTIFGNFEEARDLWTSLTLSVSGYFDAMADKRNAVLGKWKELGGRTELIEAFTSAAKILIGIFKQLGEAYRLVFPKKTGEQLYELTTRFKAFIESLKPSGATLLKLRTIFIGVFSALKIVATVISEIIRGVKNIVFGLLQSAGPVGSKVLDFFTKLALYLINLRKVLADDGGISRFFRETLPNAFDKAVASLVNFKELFINIINNVFQSSEIGEKFLKVFEQLKSGLGKVFEFIKNLFSGAANTSINVGSASLSILEKIFKGLANVGSAVIGFLGKFFEFLGKIGSYIKETFTGGDGFTKLLGLITVVFTGGVFMYLKKAVEEITGFGDGFKELIGSVTSSLQTFQTSLKAKVLKELGTAIALIAGSILVLSLIKEEKLNNALYALTIVSAQLVGLLFAFNKISSLPTGGAKLAGISAAMVAMSGAVLILSSALALLATIDKDSLAGASAALAGLLTGLVIALKSLPDAKLVALTALALYEVAGAVLLLVPSVLIFGLMEPKKLAAGIGGVTASIAAMTGSLRLLPDAKLLALTALALSEVAAAVILMTIPVLIFSRMDADKLKTGLMSVSAVLAAMTLSLRMLPDGALVAAAAAAMIGVAGAMLIMAFVVKQFSDIDPDKLKTSLIGLATVLTIMTGVLVILGQVAPQALLASGAMIAVSVAVLILSKALESIQGVISKLSELKGGDLAKGLVGLGVTIGLLVAALIGMTAAGPTVLIGAVALVIMANALGKVSDVVSEFGALKGGDLAKGLVALGVSLAILVAAITLASGAIGGAVALTIAVFALRGLFEVVQLFASMDIKALAIGLLAMAVSLGVVAGASVLLSGIAPAILIAGAALLVFGAGVTAVGLGAFLLASSIYLVVKAIELLTKMGPTAFEVILKFAALIPNILTEVGKAVINFLLEILKGIVSLIPELVNIILALGEAIIAILPELFKLLGVVLDGLITFLKDNSPKLVELITLLVNLIIDIIRTNVPKILTLIKDLLMGLFVILGELQIEFFAWAFSFILGLIRTFREGIPELVTAISDLIVSFLNNLSENLDDILKATTNLLTNLLKGLGASGSELITTAVDTMLAFVNGLVSDSVRLAEGIAIAIETFLTELKRVIDEHAPEIREKGKDLAKSLIDGMTGGLSEKVGEAVGAAKNAANAVVKSVASAFGINSPSKVFMGFGEGLIEGLILGMDNDPALAGAGAHLATTTINSAYSAIDKARNLFDGIDDSLVLRPVVDLSAVESGAKKMSGYFDNQPVFIPNISSDALFKAGSAETTQSGVNVNLTQNITSPEPVNSNEVYRRTKSQLALAKEIISK